MVVQPVVRQPVFADERLDALEGPAGKRVQLDDPTVDVVQLDRADGAPRHALLATEAGDPRVETQQRP